MVAFGWIPMRRKHLLHHGWELCKLLGTKKVPLLCSSVVVGQVVCFLHLMALVLISYLRSWHPWDFRGELPLWTCRWIHSCRQGLPQLPPQFPSRVQLERLYLCEIWRLLEALGSGVLYQPCLAPWPPSTSGFLVNWAYQTSVEHVAKGVKTRFRWFNSKVLIKSAISTLMWVVTSGSLVLWLEWHWRLEPSSAN